MAVRYVDLEAGNPGGNGSSYSARCLNPTGPGSIGGDDIRLIGYDRTSIGSWKWKSASCETGQGYYHSHNRINISSISSDTTGQRNRWTVTCSQTHYLQSGDYCIISGTSNGLIEGLVKVNAVISGTQFDTFSAYGHSSLSGSSSGGFLVHANNKVVRNATNSIDTTRIQPLLDCGPNASAWTSYGNSTAGLQYNNNYFKHWPTMQLVGIRNSGFVCYQNIYDANGNASSINTGNLQQLNWHYMCPNSSSYIRYYSNTGYSNYGSGQLRIYLYDGYNLSGNYIEYWWPWNGNVWSSAQIYAAAAHPASYSGNYNNRYPTNFNVRSIGVNCVSYNGTQDVYISGLYLSKARNVQSTYTANWSYNASLGDDSITNSSEIEDAVGHRFHIDGVTKHGDIILGGSFKVDGRSGAGSVLRDGYWRYRYGLYYFKCISTNWSINSYDTYEDYNPTETTYVTAPVIRSQYYSGQNLFNNNFQNGTRCNIYGGYKHNDQMSSRTGRSVVATTRSGEAFWYSSYSHAFYWESISCVGFDYGMNLFSYVNTTDWYMYNCAFHGCNYGVRVAQTNWSTTSFTYGFYMQNCDFNSYNGFYIGLTGSTSIGDLYIRNCRFRGQGNIPLYIDNCNVSLQESNYIYGDSYNNLATITNSQVTQRDNNGLYLQGSGCGSGDNNSILKFNACAGQGVDLHDIRCTAGVFHRRYTSSSYPLSNTRVLRVEGSNVHINYHTWYGYGQNDIVNHNSDLKIGYASINDNYTSSYAAWYTAYPYYGRRQSHGGYTSIEEPRVNNTLYNPVFYHHHSGFAEKESTIVDGGSGSSMMLEGGILSKQYYSNKRQLGSIAVDGTAPSTINMRINPYSTNINYRLIVHCNPQAGIYTDLTYNLNVGNTLNTWNDKSVTFYAPNAGILDLSVDTYDYTPGGTSGTQKVYIDNITFS